MNITDIVNTINNKGASLEETLNKCTTALDACTDPKGQYEAIKHLITPSIAKQLKEAAKVEGFLDQRKATWIIINTYNESK